MMHRYRLSEHRTQVWHRAQHKAPITVVLAGQNAKAPKSSD
jgi:hypothetical protein